MSQDRAVAVMMTLISLSLASCGAAPNSSSAHSSLPKPLEGVGRGPVFPIDQNAASTPGASPSPFTQIPFPYPPGPQARLAVFDRPRQEVFYYPASSSGIENVTTFNPGQYYYDDGKNILWLDAWREEEIKLVDGKEVGGIAFYPDTDANYHLYFIGQGNSSCASQMSGFVYECDEASASPPIDTSHYATLSAAPSITAPVQPDMAPSLATPRALTLINALAALHGQVTSLSTDAAGDSLAFTTGDGGLYLYNTQHPQVLPLLADEVVTGGFHATTCILDPVWGRYVTWQDTARKGLYCLDRWTGRIDGMSYANMALNAVSASSPMVFESDPYEIVYILTFKDGSTRLAMYHILTEQVLDLAILNDF